MGFIKNADGDDDCAIEHVFADMDEVVKEIIDHTEEQDLPNVVEIPTDTEKGKN